MGVEHGVALGQALGAGALPNLSILRLVENPHLGGDGVVAIMQGLEQGKCPLLEEIELCNTRFGSIGVDAIVHAVGSGALKSLKKMDLGSVGKEQIEAINGAREAGGCPDLRII